MKIFSHQLCEISVRSGLKNLVSRRTSSANSSENRIEAKKPALERKIGFSLQTVKERDLSGGKRLIPSRRLRV